MDVIQNSVYLFILYYHQNAGFGGNQNGSSVSYTIKPERTHNKWDKLAPEGDVSLIVSLCFTLLFSSLPH